MYLSISVCVCCTLSYLLIQRPANLGVVLAFYEICAALGRVAGPIWAGYALKLNYDYIVWTLGCVIVADFLLLLFFWKWLDPSEMDGRSSEKASPAITDATEPLLAKVGEEEEKVLPTGRRRVASGEGERVP